MTKRRTEGANGARYWIVGLFEDGPWFDGTYAIPPRGAARMWSKRYPGVPILIFGGPRIEAYLDGEPWNPRPLLRGRILGGDRPPEIEDDRQYYYPRAR